MSKKKEAFDKVTKVIRSCKNKKHIDAACRMAFAYSKLYPSISVKMLGLESYDYYNMDVDLRCALIQRNDEINLELSR